MNVGTVVVGNGMYENKEEIEQLLKDAIYVVAESYEILGDMKMMVKCARELGGFSNKFKNDASKEGSYEKGETDLKEFIKRNLGLDDSAAAKKAKDWQNFSAEVQNINSDIGIYTGREDRVKNPFVGLRAAFALDLVGDSISKDVPQPEESKQRLRDKHSLKNPEIETLSTDGGSSRF